MGNAPADSIAAIATPPGFGGVGIIRVSGSASRKVAEAMLGAVPPARYAQFQSFRDQQGRIIDSGLALFFPGPHSFTGEDVLELQAHGGPYVLDLLLQAVLSFGVRLAAPGEFSLRAFLNDKMDLLQAEAIADLIHANSEQAARSAVRSLQGEFSHQVHELLEKLIQLRMYVEAAIDFPEEEIDFLADQQLLDMMQDLQIKMQLVLDSTQQGVILNEGISVVLAGAPNAGKSSLLNYLAGQDRAIVTDIPGTTRDVIREQITLDGIPLHIIDTAGLHDSEDRVEQEGIRRSYNEIEKADVIFLLIEQEQFNENLLQHWKQKLPPKQIFVLRTKVDLASSFRPQETVGDLLSIGVSAHNGQGIAELSAALKAHLGMSAVSEGSFIARRRHLNALIQTNDHIEQSRQLLSQGMGELVAEELRQAQSQLNSLTGEFDADDLLGQIFSSFCIGK